MSLKKELKKAIGDVLAKEGMPLLLDKAFNSLWEAFAKTQPSTLNTSAKFDPDIWGSLGKNLEKFVMNKPDHAAAVVTKVRKIFGETPSPDWTHCPKLFWAIECRNFSTTTNKSPSTQTLKPEVELSEFKESSGTDTVENATSSNNLEPSQDQLFPQSLQKLHPDLEEVFGQTPVYNSLSVNNVTSSSGSPMSQRGPYGIMTESSPLRIIGPNIENEEPLFTNQEYRKHPRTLCRVLTIGAACVTILAAVGLVLIIFLIYSSTSSVSSSSEDQSNTTVSNNSLHEAEVLSKEDDTDMEFIVKSQDPIQSTVENPAMFPIPDLKTRIQEEFRALIQSPGSLIMSGENNSESSRSNNSEQLALTSSSFPMANSTIVIEGIRAGTEALLARQKTEERIEKLEVGVRNGTPGSFDPFYLFYPNPNTTFMKKKMDEIHKLSLIGFSMDRASRIIAKRLNLTKTEAEEGIILDEMTKVEPNTWCTAQILQTLDKICNRTEEYRKPDGSCNNLHHPRWGSTLQPYRRILLPDYGDGVSSPRKGIDGSQLPNPIYISQVIFRNNRRIDDPIASMFFPFWAEFIEQDMSQTVPSSDEHNTGISCCENGKLLEIQHPECFPIHVLPEDEFYNKIGQHCLTVIRSAAAPTCTFGPREQFNLNPAFIDGSRIYGSSNLDTNRLISLNPSYQHIWTKYHNKIAKELTYVNPHWDGNNVFEETKRIVVAQIQHITFNEYLPILVGPELLRKAGLRLMENEYYEGYDKRIDPDVSNVFASTASQFRLSMIQGCDDCNQTIISEIFNKTNTTNLVNPFLSETSEYSDSIIRRLAFNPAGTVDVTFTLDQMKTQGQLIHGTNDLAAIVIQRGRDHGISSYPSWRKVCGLKIIQNFTDLQGIWEEETILDAQKIYKSVDDIDLYVGGLAEKIESGVIVGPTFGCILADQYSRIRKGDRFWYEGNIQIKPFTQVQLNFIKTVTIASIFCQIFESLGAIQGQVLKQISYENPILPCSSYNIHQNFLVAWKETKPIPGIEIEIINIDNLTT